MRLSFTVRVLCDSTNTARETRAGVLVMPRAYPWVRFDLANWVSFLLLSELFRKQAFSFLVWRRNGHADVVFERSCECVVLWECWTCHKYARGHCWIPCLCQKVAPNARVLKYWASMKFRVWQTRASFGKHKMNTCSSSWACAVCLKQ